MNFDQPEAQLFFGLQNKQGCTKCRFKSLLDTVLLSVLHPMFNIVATHDFIIRATPDVNIVATYDFIICAKRDLHFIA